MGHTVKSVPVLTQIDYLKNTIIGFSTSMIDANLVGNNFRFTDIRTRQDASLWITLLGEGFCAYGMKDVMVKYRIHRESISSNKVNAAIQVWKLYFRIHRIGLLKSAYYFIYYAINAIKKRM
jgi:teichuronic acid biosynthesis glycosyltransferase TuaG